MLCPKLTPYCEAAPTAQHDRGIGYSIVDRASIKLQIEL
jgi:hypothetical protein